MILKWLPGIFAEDGFQQERGSVCVEIVPQSRRLRDVETGERLTAKTGPEGFGILTNGVWVFWPDDSPAWREIYVTSTSAESGQ